MALNYKLGLFGTWLVLSLVWIVVTLWAGLSWAAAFGIPVGFGAVSGLVVWAIRSFGARECPPEQTVALNELRQNLTAAQDENPEFYRTELDPFLGQLEAKYGNDVPIREMEGLQQLVRSKITGIERQKQEIIDRGAEEGKTIEINALRRRMEASKAAYAGPDRDAYASELDRLLESLTAKYGSRIPVDHAYKIMQDLEAGRGYTP